MYSTVHTVLVIASSRSSVKRKGKEFDFARRCAAAKLRCAMTRWAQYWGWGFSQYTRKPPRRRLRFEGYLGLSCESILYSYNIRLMRVLRVMRVWKVLKDFESNYFILHVFNIYSNRRVHNVSLREFVRRYSPVISDTHSYSFFGCAFVTTAFWTCGTLVQYEKCNLQ